MSLSRPFSTKLQIQTASLMRDSVRPSEIWPQEVCQWIRATTTQGHKFRLGVPRRPEKPGVPLAPRRRHCTATIARLRVAFEKIVSAQNRTLALATTDWRRSQPRKAPPENRDAQSPGRTINAVAYVAWIEKKVKDP